ncbi:MAG: hypothetical protein HQM00_15800 [Magnetococcales bacterium]|nr:hypothetical protein [Magnetococcales bacterium]
MTPTHSPYAPEPQQAAPEPISVEEEIKLGDLWRILVQQKWWIAIITVVCIAGSVTYALLATPYFQADILLEPAGDDAKKGGGSLGQLGGLAAMAGINIGGGGSSKDAAVARLKSRLFIEEFIEDEQLMPILFHEQWDPVRKNWKESESGKVPTRLQAVDYFKKEVLRIIEDKKTGLITMTIEWQNREQTARWANLLIERINRHMRNLAIEESKYNIEYLNKELEKNTIAELRQVIATLLEDQIKKIMLANGRPEFAFRVLDPAVVPERRIRPKRSLIVLVGAFLGLFVGVLSAFVRHSMQSAPPPAPRIPPTL